jgi:ATP-dependent Clp protease ATP-binding subunit ClpA
MFERFTKQARAVVVLAREEAAALGASAIGPEHLLLGLAGGESRASEVLASLGLGHDVLRGELVRSGSGLDADALASIGIDLDEVRRRVEESFGPGALGGRRSGRLPFTSKSKKALELALREALALGDNEIGAEHVLLGVMRDPGARVDAVLARRGQTPEAVRAAALAARKRAA